MKQKNILTTSVNYVKERDALGGGDSVHQYGSQQSSTKKS